MSASVGGVLEQVERPRSLFGPDYARLAGVALVALAVHGWLLAHTAVTARDSLGFARHALSFASPSSVLPHPDGRAKTTIDLVRESEHPPGYPLAVWVTHAGLRRALPDMAVPDRALLATQVTNAIAALLLVVPTYLIGRLLFGRNTGFAAALLFQVLPVPARVTSDGLTEGTFLLVAVSALALGVWAVKTRRVFGFLLCGLACGASYLVRPEGLLLGVGPGAVAVWLGLTRRWPRDAAAGRVAALCVGALLVSVPYMALIGKLSNKKTTEYLNPLDAPPGPVYRGGGPENSHRPLASAPPLGAWWNHELDAGKSRELWAFGAVLSETTKAANYAIWPLALFGALALRRRFAAEPALWVPVVVCAANLALLYYLAARVGYVSERHTMLVTLIGCQFAAAALPLLATAVGQALPVFDRIGIRVTAAGLLVCLVAGSLPFALKPLHANREGHKHAGRWLAEHMKENDALCDPFAWAEWYAGRTLYRTSWNPSPSRNTYIVVEPNAKTPHSRLPVMDESKRLQQDPSKRAVYQWPEGAPPDKVQVQILKLGPE